MIEDLELSELSEKSNVTGDSLVKIDPVIYGHLKTTLEVVVGSVEMTVNQLLQLKAGSVVKMLEEVNSPMILKMDGKIVASGSLVIIDDNFGFEISEIID
ncbi:hypothetical protein GCM10011613_32420 [Cellvibrio zantedeschiae]|uniref:Flagellar motor switch protein FliN-like C-terminal domain-containing protein n=1 Tax=Cellvibrio zantedeschiae TaxID=1237077 RepID=A0ABQ3BBQ8_9GAMM|nr:FliM/FliN family flagellar motor C-terminal domain-containing protein [Cellvibrio zantedeschiae]GGY84876.1 hypothetical protein GCM10011613_32420 [Cellvibrio zantedeschiae]